MNGVLDYMGKPHIQVYEKFKQKYDRLNQKYGKEQYVVPYLMSSHPGCTLQDAVKLAEWLNKTGRQPEQVQDFYPTPGTLSTCMYYTGIDPRTMEPVYVPTDPHDKAMQRALMQWKRPDKRSLVLEALRKAGREDLIGYGKECLLRPSHPGGASAAGQSERKGGGREQRPGSGRKEKDGKQKPRLKQAGLRGEHNESHARRKAGWAKPKAKKNTKPGKGRQS